MIQTNGDLVMATIFAVFTLFAVALLIEGVIVAITRDDRRLTLLMLPSPRWRGAAIVCWIVFQSFWGWVVFRSYGYWHQPTTTANPLAIALVAVALSFFCVYIVMRSVVIVRWLCRRLAS